MISVVRSSRLCVLSATWLGSWFFMDIWGVTVNVLPDFSWKMKEKWKKRKCNASSTPAGDLRHSSCSLALIIRSSEGIIRKSRNLCISTLLETVRLRKRIVDLETVNRVLIQPHWRTQTDFDWFSQTPIGKIHISNQLSHSLIKNPKFLSSDCRLGWVAKCKSPGTKPGTLQRGGTSDRRKTLKTYTALKKIKKSMRIWEVTHNPFSISGHFYERLREELERLSRWVVIPFQFQVISTRDTRYKYAYRNES